MPSFATMANSYTKIKILQKEKGLSWQKNPKPLLLLLLFNTLNTICRTMVFGCFIYFTHPHGHFDIWKATALYYGHVLLMVFFNIVFNRSSFSLSYEYFMSLLLNSLTSFFSYNHFNFFEFENKCTIKHETTFVRQGIYYVIMMLENFVLILYSYLNTTSFLIENTFGQVHQLSNTEVLRILVVIIVLQVFSFVIHILYYESHPAGVSLTNLKKKLHIYVFGTHWILWKGSCVKISCRNENVGENLLI